jgi:hypothetical protein
MRRRFPRDPEAEQLAADVEEAILGLVGEGMPLRRAIRRIMKSVLRERDPSIRPTVLVAIGGGDSSLSIRARVDVATVDPLETRVSKGCAKVLPLPRRRGD